MSPWRLRLFDLTVGLPTAVGCLRRLLPADWRRVLFRYLWRSLREDPFETLGPIPKGDSREAFSRQQLGPVLLLNEVLRTDLGLDEAAAFEVLEVVVGTTGARFVRSQLGSLEPAQWLAWTRDERLATVNRIAALFLNATVDPQLDLSDRAFGFEISACRFVTLCARLGVPELSSLFCAADRRFFDDPAVPFRLDRPQTLAAGDSRCVFRISMDDEPENPKG